ncbi:MAG: HEAT repeat domain-containing protein [Cyanobacteria bacterium P01_H01_bin.15]
MGLGIAGFGLGLIIGAGILFFVMKGGSASSGEVEQLRSRLAGQEQDFESRKQEMITSLQEQYRLQAEERITERSQELGEQYKTEIQNLEAQLREARSEQESPATDSEGLAASLQEQIAVLETQNADLRQTLAAAPDPEKIAQDIAALESGYQARIQELETLNTSLSGSSDNASVDTDVQNQLQTLESQVAELTSQLEAKDAELAEKPDGTVLEASQQRIQELENQENQFRAQIENLETQLRDAQSRLEATPNVGELEASFQGRIQELEGQNQTLQTQLSQAPDIGQLERGYQERIQALETQKQELEASLAAAPDIEALTQSHEAQVQALQEDLRSQTAAKDEALASVRQEYDQQMEQLNTQIQQLSAQATAATASAVAGSAGLLDELKPRTTEADVDSEFAELSNLLEDDESSLTAEPETVQSLDDQIAGLSEFLSGDSDSEDDDVDIDALFDLADDDTDTPGDTDIFKMTLQAHGAAGGSGFEEPSNTEILNELAADGLSEAEILKQEILALGPAEQVEAIPALLEYGNNPDESTRRLAASALGEIAERVGAEPLRQALPTLSQLAKDGSPSVRQAAIQSLGKIRLDDV